MAVQDQVGVTLTYGIQSAFGTLATAGGTSKRIRRTGSNIDPQKGVFTSQEVRPDQQIATVRHGGEMVTGTIDGELCLSDWDDFLTALMRQSSRTAGLTASNSDFTSCTISSNVATMGGGSMITKGLKVGDIFRFTNMSVAANNNVNYRITALTATTMSTYPSMTDNSIDSAFNMAVQGFKLQFGTAKTAFTIEENYPDLDQSLRFDNMRIGGASFRIPPNDICRVSWQFMGNDFTQLSGASAPYFTSVTSAGVGAALTGIEGGIRVGGVEYGIITGMDLNISHNLNAQPVIGTPNVPDIFYGRIVVTGTVTYFLQDTALTGLFINETEADIVAVLSDDASAPKGFIAFNMQRVKLNGISRQIQADGGVLVTSPFQAMIKSGGSGTIYDQSTLTIQMSA